MNKRSGPFWDGVEGRAPVPRAAATLGLEFITADSATGTIELAFTAGENFTNPAGNVLGAFVAAMLYDTVGPALLATLEPDQFQSEILATTLQPLRRRLPPRTYRRLLKALAVVYGIEPMIILKDICGATDRETEAVVRWMMDALVDAALREH